MKTLSPLASQILPMLTAPLTLEGVRSLFADDTSLDEIEGALDEMIPRLVTCDAYEGAEYFYRRDTEAERARATKWSDAQRAAEKARQAAINEAERAYVVAMDAADAERDAAAPMAQIKARVAA